jgi:hypothetical protein
VGLCFESAVLLLLLHRWARAGPLQPVVSLTVTCVGPFWAIQHLGNLLELAHQVPEQLLLKLSGGRIAGRVATAQDAQVGWHFE